MGKGKFVKELYVKLSSYRDVQKLSAIVTQVGCPIKATDGSRIVNACSLLSLFSLRLTQPLLLKMECSDAEYAEFCHMADVLVLK